MIAVAALIIAAAILAVAVAQHVTGDAVLRSRTKRRALVTTHDGAWFVGVLVAHDRRCFVLANAQSEGEDGTPAPVDGEVLILAEDVAHIQFP